MIFDDLNVLEEVQDKEFVVLSPVSYSGRNRTAKNARWLYGIATVSYTHLDVYKRQGLPLT